jgi:hypothetical protein
MLAAEGAQFVVNDPGCTHGGVGGEVAANGADVSNWN